MRKLFHKKYPLNKEEEIKTKIAYDFVIPRKYQ